MLLRLVSLQISGYHNCRSFLLLFKGGWPTVLLRPFPEVTQDTEDVDRYDGVGLNGIARLGRRAGHGEKARA